MSFGPRALLLAAALAVACGERPELATVVDHAGHPLRLASPPERIVSLSPSITELLFALGWGERLVGRTRWSSYPPEAQAIPSVGDGLDPNLEIVTARRPDLVVFYHTPANAAAIARLDDLGIASVSVRLDQLDDVDPAVRLLGRVMGDSVRADSVADAFQRELDRLRRRSFDVRVGTLLLAWDAPPIVIGGGSFLSEIVHLAGGRNVFADLRQPSATVSIEAIAVRTPDVVLLVEESDLAVAGRPEWETITAVRERRFVRVHGSEFSWPSLRAGQAVAQLAEALATGSP
ncbi:MAG: helical backbone metal receptor [Gemmatimonadota bacterium]|nr:helical backbone metal receptor [Gemmatimonadota bacterium]